MNQRGCLQTSELIRRVRSDPNDADLQRHLEGCEDCRQSADVVLVLARLARDRSDVPTFADTLLRVRARRILAESLTETERSVRPLRIFKSYAGVGSLAAVAVLLFQPELVGAESSAGFILMLIVSAFGSSLIQDAASSRAEI